MANKTVTVKPSGGTYTTLQAAITGEVTANANLTAAGMDGILTISIEGTWSSADTTAVDINGFTVDSTHYVRIVADSANRAIKTSYSTSRYSLEVSNATGIINRQNYTRIDGLQIKLNATAAGTFSAIQATISGISTGADVFISNCRIAQGAFSEGTVYGIYMYDSANSYGDVYIYNCIITGFNNANIRATYSQTTMIYNCIIYGGATKGVSQPSANFGNPDIKNCAIFVNSDDIAIDTGGTIDYCALDDADAQTHPVTESGGGENWPDDFTDAANGDFTLKTTSGLVGTGLADPGSGLFSTDIDGDTRPAAWSVGADDITSAAPAASRMADQLLWWHRAFEL